MALYSLPVTTRQTTVYVVDATSGTDAGMKLGAALASGDVPPNVTIQTSRNITSAKPIDAESAAALFKDDPDALAVLGLVAPPVFKDDDTEA